MCQKHIFVCKWRNIWVRTFFSIFFFNIKLGSLIDTDWTHTCFIVQPFLHIKLCLSASIWWKEEGEMEEVRKERRSGEEKGEEGEGQEGVGQGRGKEYSNNTQKRSKCIRYYIIYILPNSSLWHAGMRWVMVQCTVVYFPQIVIWCNSIFKYFPQK